MASRKWLRDDGREMSPGKRVWYRGELFRSYLEFLWARELTFLNLDWRYEPQRFFFARDSYLPDFLLPTFDCYLEVKPLDPTWKELFQAKHLCEWTRNPVYFLIGRPQVAIFTVFRPAMFQGQPIVHYSETVAPWS